MNNKFVSIAGTIIDQLVFRLKFLISHWNNVHLSRWIRSVVNAQTWHHFQNVISKNNAHRFLVLMLPLASCNNIELANVDCDVKIDHKISFYALMIRDEVIKVDGRCCRYWWLLLLLQPFEFSLFFRNLCSNFQVRFRSDFRATRVAAN